MSHNTSTAFSIRRDNWCNKNVFPDMVYIDTNVVLDIMERRKYWKTSEEYLKELVKRDGMIIWSSHVIDEVIDFFHYQVYEEAASQITVPNNISPPNWKWLENNATDIESSNYANQVLEKVNNTIQYLEQFGVQSDPDLNEVIPLTLQLYSKFGLNRKDARHVAIATLSGTNNILTHDSGFLRFPHTNVFGASKAIVENTNLVINDPNNYVDLRELLNENRDVNSEEDALL